MWLQDAGLPTLVRETISETVQFLERRFARLKYKGEPMEVHKPATSDEVKEGFATLNRIVDRDDWSTLTKKDAMDIAQVKVFYNRHVVETKYSFQVRQVRALYPPTLSLRRPRLM